jgi:NADH:ubiquinone reductase (H+-translocating)
MSARPRVLVIGTGFAGFHCLRKLERKLPEDAAELVAINPADYMLYIPLLPRSPAECSTRAGSRCRCGTR